MILHEGCRRDSGRVPRGGVRALDKWPAGATVQSQAQAGQLSKAVVIVVPR
jgi:hypothetical protein